MLCYIEVKVKPQNINSHHSDMWSLTYLILLWLAHYVFLH